MNSNATKSGKEVIETDLGLFRDLINKSNDAIFVVDPATGLFIFVNDKSCAALGYDRAELLRMGVTDIEDSLPDNFLWQTHLNELREKGSLVFEGRHKRKNGTIFPVEANIRHVVMNGREYLVTVVRDISERRQAEAALRAREKQLTESQRIAHIGSWEHNLKTGQVFWSDELFRLFDMEPANSPADFDAFFSIVHHDDQRMLRKAVDEALHEQKPFSIDYRLVLRSGETRIIHAQAELVGDDSGDLVVLSGTAQDITERKRQEEALAESEANYRSLFDSSTDGIFILDPDGNFIDANRTAYERLGYTREEILALNISKLDDPSFAPRVPERLGRIREQGVVVFESCHLRKDGSMMPVEVNSRLLEYKGRQVFFSVVRDITERKQAEEKLRMSEERFRTLAEAAFEGIAVTEEGIFLDANRQLCDMLGYSLDELREKPVTEIIAPEDRELVRRNQSMGYEPPYENRLLRKDGSVIFAESRARHFTIRDRKVRVTVIRDITGRKRTEEDLLKTQKLESLGILAGGIAHDFNNILTSILGNVSLARISMKQQGPQSARLEEAERACYHARELTQQLLTFAKGGAPVKKTVSVEQLVRDSAGFAVRGSSVRCGFSFGDNIRPVDVDEGQMRQVFNNLVINACQAMPGGGTIKIDVRNVDTDPEDGTGMPGGEYVKISMEDQGTGIPEEHLQRIFDPYFTTKQKGSGLGLSIVYSVLKNHNAHITVTSRPGAGTTFVIYLPASTSNVVAKELAGEDYGAGSGRVLIMDDEEIVRQIAGDILKEMGYEVEFARDGAEAVRLYRNSMSSRPFDVVIMDLTVPGGMGGKEAIRELREADPGARAIVSSGYSRDPVMANYREYGFCEVIAKPFSSIELSRIMRKVIGGR